MKLRFLSCLVAFLAMISATPATMGDYQIEFPRDEGAHPTFQTEWWYVTGWLQDPSGKERGFQITFFRSRNSPADANPSAFAARQLIFAHAALSDPNEDRLIRSERSARSGFGLANAVESKLDVVLDNWSLRADDDRYMAQVVGEEFELALNLERRQPPLLHGDGGYSRKGPDAVASSYYYSLPHMRVSGSIKIRGHRHSVSGSAWLDHEWSNHYVDERAVGWDWLGINLFDGSALMAFRMRRNDGTIHWHAGTLRNSASGVGQPLNDLQWHPTELWRSPRTGTEYPIAWRIRTNDRELLLVPVMRDQENDARGSVGILYWEGAVEARGLDGKLLGRGYLELTGYDRPAHL